MFSRLALRSGAFGPLVRAATQKNGLQLAAVRCSSSETSIQKHIENWDKANAIYYGPERDTANFPHPRQPETTPPTRMLCLPESWFKFMEEKTGVTGPYALGTGVVLTMLSKEIWVIEHTFTEFVAFWIAAAILVKKLGPGMQKWLDSTHETYMQNNWSKPIEAAKAQSKETIASGERAIWEQEGQKALFAAKKENVGLQLEAVYRQRLSQVHDAVKKRLDYQVAKEEAERSFQQRHMVNWIVDSVVKGITPQQEKDSITRCLADLKTIAARQ